MIAMADLEFQFPHSDFRLGVPSLKVAGAERVAIIGPSGSGKTTLLHLVSGILSPVRGTIRVQDRELNSLGDGARRAFRVAHIGLVFQSFELVSYLDVCENILLPYRLNPALRLTPGIARRAEQLANETGIAHRLRYFPRRLSQGEKQRVALCRALLPEPPLLLADEPRAISIHQRSSASWISCSSKSSAPARRCCWSRTTRKSPRASRA